MHIPRFFFVHERTHSSHLRWLNIENNIRKQMKFPSIFFRGVCFEVFLVIENVIDLQSRDPRLYYLFYIV